MQISSAIIFSVLAVWSFAWYFIGVLPLYSGILECILHAVFYLIYLGLTLVYTVFLIKKPVNNQPTILRTYYSIVLLLAQFFPLCSGIFYLFLIIRLLIKLAIPVGLMIASFCLKSTIKESEYLAKKYLKLPENYINHNNKV